MSSVSDGGGLGFVDDGPFAEVGGDAELAAEQGIAEQQALAVTGFLQAATAVDDTKPVADGKGGKDVEGPEEECLHAMRGSPCGKVQPFSGCEIAPGAK